MNHPSRSMAYRALRGVLHALRERRQVAEAQHLGAQLPLIIRGVYFEGYRVAIKPLKMRRFDFLAYVAEELQSTGGADLQALWQIPA